MSLVITLWMRSSLPLTLSVWQILLNHMCTYLVCISPLCQCFSFTEMYGHGNQAAVIQLNVLCCLICTPSWRGVEPLIWALAWRWLLFSSPMFGTWYTSSTSSHFPPSYFLLRVRAVVAHLWRTDRQTDRAGQGGNKQRDISLNCKLRMTKSNLILQV